MKFSFYHVVMDYCDFLVIKLEKVFHKHFRNFVSFQWKSKLSFCRAEMAPADLSTEQWEVNDRCF